MKSISGVEAMDDDAQVDPLEEKPGETEARWSYDMYSSSSADCALSWTLKLSAVFFVRIHGTLRLCSQAVSKIQ